MKKYLIPFFLFFSFLTFLTSCGTMESELGRCDASISSTGYLLSSDCRPLSWGQRLPIYLRYGISMTEDARQAFDEAIRIWNGALRSDVLQVVDRATQDPIGSENDLNTHLIGMRSGANWTQCDQSVMICGSKDEPAKTVYHYSEFLVDADIMINKDFALSFQYDPAKFDLTSIALHELGHVLGLDHDNEMTPQISIMNASISEGQTRSLSDRDIQRVRTLYGL